MIETIKEYLANKDYPSLYKVIYESEAVADELKQELLSQVLEMALEQVYENIVTKKKIDFEAQSEQFMLRFLYDDAMAMYEAKEQYEARESLALLSVVTDSKHFEKSIKRHICALVLNVGFEEFIQAWVEPVEMKHFYLSCFQKQSEKLFKEHNSAVEMARNRYRKLFK